MPIEETDAIDDTCNENSFTLQLGPYQRQIWKRSDKPPPAKSNSVSSGFDQRKIETC